MKKIIAIILVVCLTLCLAACGNTASQPDKNASTNVTKPINDENLPSKTGKEPTKPSEEVTEPVDSTETPNNSTESFEINMGEAGEYIYLSELEPGKTYIYDVSKAQDEYFQQVEQNIEMPYIILWPHVVNDTANPMARVTVTVDDEETFESDLFNKTITKFAPLAQHVWNQLQATNPEKAKTLRLTFDYLEITDDFINTKAVKLSNYNVDELIDMEMKNYLYNDTESTLVIQVSMEGVYEEKYEILHNEVLETSFTYNHQITEIK